MPIRPGIAALASTVARELAGQGAQAVVLTGSQLRNDVHPHSDVDIYAIGDGPAYCLEVREGHLVSISWRTVAAIEEEFRSPRLAPATVSGWRGAKILHDPNQIAAGIIARATEWTWDHIGQSRLDEWVTEELTGYTEEVVKMVNLLEQERPEAAAIQRSVLALRIPVIMAVHLRLLYTSENDLWTLVAARMGKEWQRTQEMAQGLAGELFHAQCEAAARLFLLAREQVWPLCDDRQKRVLNLAHQAVARLEQWSAGNSILTDDAARSGAAGDFGIGDNHISGENKGFTHREDSPAGGSNLD
jgi:hypothetical protein